MPTTTFTSDWFTEKTGPWVEHVVPRLRDTPRAHWLELGSYEGRSALWTLDNVLPPDGHITCVDFFDDEQAYVDLWGAARGYAQRFDANVAGRSVDRRSGRTSDVLVDLLLEGARFCGAYVDADHHKRPLAADLALTWPLLLPGAVLVCDDYGWQDMPEARAVMDAFFSCPGIRCEVLHRGFQIIVVKLE